MYYLSYTLGADTIRCVHCTKYLNSNTEHRNGVVVNSLNVHYYNTLLSELHVISKLRKSKISVPTYPLYYGRYTIH